MCLAELAAFSLIEINGLSNAQTDYAARFVTPVLSWRRQFARIISAEL